MAIELNEWEVGVYNNIPVSIRLWNGKILHGVKMSMREYFDVLYHDMPVLVWKDSNMDYPTGVFG